VIPGCKKTKIVIIVIVSNEGLSHAEQETIICLDEDEKLAHWYSSSPVSIRRMEKLAAAYPYAYNLAQSQSDDARFVFDPRYLRYGKPISEARREAMRSKNSLSREF
jgi:hypothetical protein